MKFFKLLSFACLFVFLSLIADSAFSASAWVRETYASYYRALKYPTCDISYVVDSLNSAWSTKSGYCEGRANSFSPARAWRMQKAEAVTGDCGSHSGNRYWCETNPDPCDDPLVWNQETQSCQEDPEDHFTCQPGTIPGPVDGTCVPEACSEGQKRDSVTGDCVADCPSGEAFLSGPPNFSFTCKGGCSLSAGSKGICVSSGGTQTCDYSYTGENCDSSSQQENVATASNDCADCGTNENMTCPQGQVYFSMGGTSGCYDATSSNTNIIPAPPVTTESTSTTTTSTVTNPDGSTTTTTITTSGSSSSGGSSGGSGGSSGGSSSGSTKTIVTTVNPDGSSTTTITETSEEDSLSIPDTPASGAESFWQSEYPDGLNGIWQKHQASFSSTPLANWLNSWAFPSSGSCPSFGFSFDFGFVSFGNQSLPSDMFCYVFPAVRLIFIISALLLARRLVFGG